MASLALLDLVSPFALGGAAFGEPLHEFLTTLFVEAAETSFDQSGLSVRGTARFSPDVTVNPPVFTPPASISFGGTASVDHRTTRSQGAWWDFPDIAIGFRLSAPRASSPVGDLVVSGDATLGPFLSSLGQGAGDAPDTAFRLDLLIDAATLHLPFLRGAKLRADGMLEADPLKPDVKVTLPKIKLTISQDSGAVSGAAVTDPVLSINFDSWAAHDIDDPDGSFFAEVLRMDPPYALFGPGDTLGFGFETLILDLSATVTPPELLAKFGVGDDFRGLYLPDVRVFVSGSEGLKGLAVDVSARELLIGLGPEAGISGLFGVDIVNPAKALGAVILIYDDRGRLLQRIELPEVSNPPFATAVAVPVTTFWLINVNGGQPPYNITVDGQVQGDTWTAVTIPAGQTEKSVAVTIADVHGGPSRTATVGLTLTAPSLAASPPAPIDQRATLTVLHAGPPGTSITIEDNPHAEQVTILFTPADPKVAALTVQGNSQPLQVVGGRALVKLPHGGKADVAATWTVAAVPASTPTPLEAFFQYDEPTSREAPSETDAATAVWVTSPDNIHHTPSRDEHQPALGWTDEGDYLSTSPALSAWLGKLQAMNPVPAIVITGSASHEDRPNPAYNIDLSRRRVWALEAFLRGFGVTKFDPPIVSGEIGVTGYGRGANRKAIASFLSGGTPAGSSDASVRLERPARPPVPPPFEPNAPKVQPAGSPAIQFRELHVRVEIDHNHLIAIELKLKVDVETVLESYLSKVKAGNPGALPPAGRGSTNLPVGKQADPNDGVIDMRVQITLDDTVGRWQFLASLFENDKDGFLQTPPPSAVGQGGDQAQFWRTYFGVLVALAPLLDDIASANTVPGDITALGIGVAVPLAAAATDFIDNSPFTIVVPRITVYGGELRLTHDPNGTRGALLLDVEVALLLGAGIGSARLIDTKPDNPITVRYKAIGFKTSDQPRFRDLVPVFDSSKGYTINIPSGGGITVPDPLGDILQVAGTRIARSNPVNIELDLEIKADLGVVSVDRTTIRVPLDGSGGPTLTALGVHIDIPGAVEGHGYLAIYPDGFAGQIDCSLPGLGVRIAAGLSVRHAIDPNNASHTATAVIVTLEVDFPVPILIGNSGLGIYGFGGLFALHFKRNENLSAPVPALDWLTNVVHGNPLDIAGWVPDIDHWAIGVGAVVGTVDAGFTLNVKGMLIFEMPGPRILLVMKASLLFPRPPREGDVTATILAVIDVDLGRHMITIGITFDWSIDPLVEIHIPIRAIFPFDDITNFAIDAGSWWNPATVTFFKVFTARGYFMIRGRDIPSVTYDADHTDFPLGQLRGFSIATGVSASYKWGDEGSGLYLSVGSSLDVGLGFSPILFRGEMRLWGELHLWIVGIEASARLSVTIGEVATGPADPQGHLPTRKVSIIDGEVHGKIDLFFFDLEGSVHVTLGTDPGPVPAVPPPLVTGVTLHSRSAALLTGSGIDRPIDGKLADARRNAADVVDAEAVPIDSIIVIHFDCVPRIAAGATFDAQAGSDARQVAIGPPSGSGSPKVRRGDPYYTYRLKGVRLGAALTNGEVPIVWWEMDPGVEPVADETKLQLALLSRVPSAHPSAIERSRHLSASLEHSWSTVCDPVAPATAVLWTFDAAANGPSAVGWTLTGVAWPDKPGDRRSKSPNLVLHVADPYAANETRNAVLPTNPARVVSGLVSCDRGCAPKDVRPRAPDGASRIDQLVEIVNPAAFGLAAADAIAAARSSASPAAAQDQPRSMSVLFRPPAELERKLGWSSSDFRCLAKALEAPFRWATVSGLQSAHPLSDVINTLATAALGRDDNGSRLDDVVAFSGGEIVESRLLLAVPDMLLRSGQLILRAFDANGKPLRDWQIDGKGNPSRIVDSRDALPKTWTDPGGPWFCAVSEVLKFLAGLGGPNPVRAGIALVLIEVKLPKGTVFLQTGVLKLDALLRKGLSRPSYFVGIIETVSAAEIARHDTDQSIADQQVQTINGALEGLKDKAPALLHPRTDYAVHVEWEWAVCDKDGVVAKPDDAATWHGDSVDYTFRTDDVPLKPAVVNASPGDGAPVAAMTMPVRLDPWVLITDPDEGDAFFFPSEKLRVVLAVDYLLDMFEAYQTPLEAKVRAASFRNSDPGSPTFPKTVHALGKTDAKPLVGAAVFTPWESTIRGVLGKAPCIDTAGVVSRQRRIDLDLLLEPRTDYVFDIDVVGKPAPPPGTAATPLFRRKFSTSRYRDLDALCAAVAAAEVRQAPAALADLAGLLALSSTPPPLSAGQIDAALRSAGLRPATEVDVPEVDVLWVGPPGAAQPLVVVLRTPEPLVRMRRTPVDVEPPGQPRLGRKISRLEPRPFLEIVATPGIPGAADVTVVAAPKIGTAIIALQNARGKVLDLSIRRHDDPFLDGGTSTVDVALLHMLLSTAPWETT